MQRYEQAGGGVGAVRSTHYNPGTGAVSLRGRGHFGVDGPVARAEERRVREQDTRTSEQAWLSDGLSRGFAGTRIA